MAVQKTGRSITKYFRSVVAELKKVAWPSRRETTVYTVVVIVTVVIVSMLIGVFDILLSLFFSSWLY